MHREYPVNIRYTSTIVIVSIIENTILNNTNRTVTHFMVVKVPVNRGSMSLSVFSVYHWRLPPFSHQSCFAHGSIEQWRFWLFICKRLQSAAVIR